jgi:hypothetical protein
MGHSGRAARAARACLAITLAIFFASVYACPGHDSFGASRNLLQEMTSKGASSGSGRPLARRTCGAPDLLPEEIAAKEKEFNRLSKQMGITGDKRSAMLSRVFRGLRVGGLGGTVCSTPRQHGWIFRRSTCQPSLETLHYCALRNRRKIRV